MQTLILRGARTVAALAALLLLGTVPPAAARQSTPVYDQAFNCLALTVYFEAGGESLEGQQGVAHVVLNRTSDGAFPRSVCAVVRQRRAQRGCQFSWWCDGRSDVPPPSASWSQAQRVARDALAGRSADPTDGALYFHRADLGRLSWTRRLTRTARIGEHVYYR